ncbi:unnamed protein product [Caenorhabditis angaria]|uniref:TIMELESS-interacting protein n=1 Tax=Caenorhabditis angaria TaxID=860376 RepID=A0A9P1I6C3_9PELO|nr:unnamed protein product [Caenorhabditis angaria]
MEDEYADFFGGDDFDRDQSPEGDEAIEVPVPGADIPAGKVVKPPRKQSNRFLLNEKLLAGPKGISALKKEFENFQPGPDPYQNLNLMFKKYNHWAHLMYPNMKFEDIISRCETLGTRRWTKVILNKMRLGMPLTDEDFEQSAGGKDGESKKKKSKNEDCDIIDDGASDGEEEIAPAAAPEASEDKNSEKSEKAAENDYPDEEDQREQEEDELMADFDW